LAHHGEEARIVAGGHSLIPMMKLRLARPEHLVDLQDLKELRGIQTDPDTVIIGAMMTIPGINMVVALALIAATGDIKRFAKPEQLVGYLGLNPSVRQSGPGPAYHGRITKQGRGHARGMLVEAGWVAARC